MFKECVFIVFNLFGLTEENTMALTLTQFVCIQQAADQAIYLVKKADNIQMVKRMRINIIQQKTKVNA